MKNVFLTNSNSTPMIKTSNYSVQSISNNTIKKKYSNYKNDNYNFYNNNNKSINELNESREKNKNIEFYPYPLALNSFGNLRNNILFRIQHPEKPIDKTNIINFKSNPKLKKYSSSINIKKKYNFNNNNNDNDIDYSLLSNIKKNNNNNKNIITNFISTLSKAISDETSHTEINNKNNINNNSNKMYSFSKNDKTNDIKNINKDNVLNQIQINTPSPNKNIIINHSPTFTLLKNNENVQKLYSQRILEKYNNSNLINNDIFNNNIINEINKNNQINIEEEKQYSMTDSNSNDSGSDEDDSSSNNLKFVPDWAKNKEYLTKCINEQNSNINEIVENIFGKYNIEKLNLNMIFESNNTKYTIRHSTADWKFDNSMKSINNEIINYKKLVEQQLTGFNEKTSKQLKFESNNKN
jgi:hypothetical protein